MDKFNLPVTIYIAIILSGWIKNGRDMQGLDILYNKKLCYASPFTFSRKHFTRCYTIWRVDQEKTWYYTKIDQLFVKMEGNIQAKPKEGLSNCSVKNWRLLWIQLKQSSRVFYILIFWQIQWLKQKSISKSWWKTQQNVRSYF